MICMQSVTKDGWTRSFSNFWLKVHYIPNAISYWPLLLLLDGLTLSLPLSNMHRITICCFPPHTTHECQPLDCSLFGLLKKHWQEACHIFRQWNPGKVISKINFFKNAWLNAVLQASMMRGTKKVVHVARAITVRVLRCQLQANCQEGTKMPSIPWIRLQFWPKTRYSWALYRKAQHIFHGAVEVISQVTHWCTLCSSYHSVRARDVTPVSRQVSIHMLGWQTSHWDRRARPPSAAIEWRKRIRISPKHSIHLR